MSNRRRLQLMLAGVLLLLGTLFLMWKRTSVGTVQLDLWTTSLAGVVSAEDPTELWLGLDAQAMSFDSLQSVDAYGALYTGASLGLRSKSTNGLRLSSLSAPSGCRLELALGATGRLRLTVQPAKGTDVVTAQVDVRPGALADFDGDSRLARELERSPVSSLMSCSGAPGEPLTIVLDSKKWIETPEVLAGFSGLQLAALDFLVPVHAALDGPGQIESGIKSGECLVSHSGDDPVILPRAGVLSAEEWNGFVSSLAVTSEGLRLEWHGSAKRLRAGHPSDPQLILPVLFQRWFGHSPRAYISLIVVYVSLLPIMGILRSLLGRSNFNPGLDLEEPA